MRGRRGRRWIVEVADRGLVDVLRGDRRLRSNVSPEQAMKYIQRHRVSGDRVFRREDDGYLVEINGKA